MAKTVVCLCQDVTLEDLQRLVQEGFGHSETLKRISGALTGPCQGKYCASAVRRILQDLVSASGDDGPPRRPTVRAPITPVLLGHLADLGDAARTDDGA